MLTEVKTRYDADKEAFLALGGRIDEERPIIGEWGASYSQDGQYLLMNLWAFKKIREAAPAVHVDIGSQLQLIMFLSLYTRVEFVDIRDPGLRAQNVTYIKGSVTKLPYPDNSVESLSSLHVCEHIGLGRYGDEVDPEGFNKACRELYRVLKPGGRLYFAVPMGKDKVVFNAHRVISSRTLIAAFPRFDKVEFSGVTSGGVFSQDVPVHSLDGDDYGCGMVVLTK